MPEIRDILLTADDRVQAEIHADGFRERLWSRNRPGLIVVEPNVRSKIASGGEWRIVWIVDSVDLLKLRQSQ